MPASTPPSPARLRRLRRALLGWYDENRRDLPWRDTDDPYRVLVSEFMLQQTTVAAVLPRYPRFLARFPTLPDLARADEEEVRAAWTGLGYYRRAANLHAAARTLTREYEGRLPDRLELLRELPGVGEYTAAALGSIVHGIPKAVVDGNVIRVLTRLAAIGGGIDRAPVRREVAGLADALVEPSRPGDWNQAMMELGATVCAPRSPACPECPWRGDCAARAEGNPERYPVKKPGRAPVAVIRAAAIVRRGGALLLVRRRDPRLLDGTWEFPGVDVKPAADPRRSLAAFLRGAFGPEARVGDEVGKVKHSITHRRITLTGFAVELGKRRLPAGRDRRWVPPETLEALPLSSATLKLYRRVFESRSHSTYAHRASRSPGARKRS
jgi:A/G-specific adenine glycosylase